jgi:uracil phosphoribosyltransferase
MPVHVVDHPALADALCRLRDKTTPPAEFRRLSRIAGVILATEATRSLPTAETEVVTPLETTRCAHVVQEVIAVPILRAGLGLLEGFLEIVPGARVGYLGLERDEATAIARLYYGKVPGDLAKASVFLLDPMLATGGSAAKAFALLAERGARQVTLLSVVAAPEGIAAIEAAAPSATIVTAAIDRGLDERKYIRPGLGDFGDRLYGS